MKKHYIKQSNPQTIHSLFMLPDLFSSFLLILLQLIHFSNNFHFHCFTSFSFCLSLSLTVSIFFSIHLYLSLFACLTLFLSVSLNLLLSVSLLFYPSLCIHLFPSFCLLLQSPSLCISLCPSMCLFLSLSLLLSSIFTSHLFVCLFPSVSLSVSYSSNRIILPIRFFWTIRFSKPVVASRLLWFTTMQKFAHPVWQALVCSFLTESALCSFLFRAGNSVGWSEESARIKKMTRARKYRLNLAEKVQRYKDECAIIFKW